VNQFGAFQRRSSSRLGPKAIPGGQSDSTISVDGQLSSALNPDQHLSASLAKAVLSVLQERCGNISLRQLVHPFLADPSSKFIHSFLFPSLASVNEAKSPISQQ
jgi:hypothetical protein